MSPRKAVVNIMRLRVREAELDADIAGEPCLVIPMSMKNWFIAFSAEDVAVLTKAATDAFAGPSAAESEQPKTVPFLDQPRLWLGGLAATAATLTARDWARELCGRLDDVASLRASLEAAQLARQNAQRAADEREGWLKQRDADLEAARKALEPFAMQAANMRGYPDHIPISGNLKVGHLRAAARALGDKP